MAARRTRTTLAKNRVLFPFVLSLPVLSLSKSRSMNGHGHKCLF